MSSNNRVSHPRIVTLISKYEGSQVTQIEGKAQRARLFARAPGLDIYLSGSMSGKYTMDRLNHMAMTMAQSMNIPLSALHYVKGNGK